MDNPTLYTRCPTCNTAFKVTDELLAIAAGKVRCGACLAIFQASDYMLEPAKKTQITEAESPTIANKNETSISDFIQQKTHLNEPEQKSEATDNELTQKTSEPSSQNDIEEQNLFAEDFYTEDDLEDESAEIKDVENEPNPIEEEQLSFEETFDHEEGIDSEIIKSSDLEPSELDSEIEDAFSLEDETSLEDGINSEENDSTEFGADEEDLEIEDNDYLDEGLDLELPEQKDFYEEDNLQFDEIETDEFSDNEFETELELTEQINAQIEDVETEPDPLDEFSDIVEVNKSGIRSKIIISSIIILLIISLFQTWSHRQAIAWNETWGPIMKSICNHLPCHLKPKRAVNEIKLLQRQVSPHQDKEKTLDIKVLLVNQADFAQPYPVIKIAFSDKNGKEVSTKRFKPANYLREGSKTELMPPNAEVHIQFDTKTPHPDALGFEFIFE